MTISRQSMRAEPAEVQGLADHVTEAQVDDFLRKVLDVQRRFFYETNRRLREDLRTELRRHARIILGAEKRSAK